jgi:DNA-binding transcriptional regulator GbsR (MarR family)
MNTKANTAVTAFVETWGTMGSLWGVNASTARVHALLMASSEPISLDEIAEVLMISRGNVSMCLRELRSWGVIHLKKEPGDRKDYYVTEPDVWKMFFAIAKERKRRELEPALEAVQGVVEELDAIVSPDVQARMRQMKELLTTMSNVADKVLGDEKKARYLLSLVSGS